MSLRCLYVNICIRTGLFAHTLISALKGPLCGHKKTPNIFISGNKGSLGCNFIVVRAYQVNSSPSLIINIAQTPGRHQGEFVISVQWEVSSNILPAGCIRAPITPTSCTFMANSVAIFKQIREFSFRLSRGSVEMHRWEI